MTEKLDYDAIIIGAGRGRRLMPTTENAPKCFAEIRGKRILDWIVEALSAGGVLAKIGSRDNVTIKASAIEKKFGISSLLHGLK